MFKRPSVEKIYFEDPIQHIEYAARVCTNTEDKVSSGKESRDFVQKRIQTQEWSVMEHAGIDVAEHMPHLDKLSEMSPEFGLVMSRAVLGGIRLSDLMKYCSLYSTVDSLYNNDKFSLKRDKQLLSFLVTCSRATSQQFERHRNFSYCEKSLRYTKAKELSIVTIDEKELEKYKQSYEFILSNIQNKYEEFLESGMSRDEARKILPLGIETKFMVTGHITWWYDLLSKRYSKFASPDFIYIAQQLYEYMPDVLKARVNDTGLDKQFKKADEVVKRYTE